MDLSTLIDGPSAAIVIGGTLLATVMRSGLDECVTTLKALAMLRRSRFDADEARAKLAAQVIEIRRDGVLRASAPRSGDAEFDDAAGAMIERRSIDALLERHEAFKAQRLAGAEVGVRTLAQAAEVAPAFGLVGTLVSLAQLPPGGIAQGDLMGAISMAVLTTLYGLLSANLVYAPLSRALERAAQVEEDARLRVIDWLAGQLASAMPVTESPHGVAPLARRAAA